MRRIALSSETTRLMASELRGAELRVTSAIIMLLKVSLSLLKVSLSSLFAFASLVGSPQLTPARPRTYNERFNSGSEKATWQLTVDREPSAPTTARARTT